MLPSTTPPGPLLTDIYVTREFLDDRYQRAQQAISRAPRGSYISHHTAAALRGLWPPSSPTIHVSVPPRARRALPRGITVHRGHHDAWVTRLGGLPVAHPAQAVVDLARGLRLADLLPLVDSLLRRDPDGLQGIRARAAEQAVHLRRLHRALELARLGPDSPMESRMRLLLLLAGFPEPDLQIPVPRHIGKDTDGGNVISDGNAVSDGNVVSDDEWDAGSPLRLDLGYKELRVGAEYGGAHHRSPHQRAIDTTRRAAVRADGWLLHVATGRDLMSHPQAFLTSFAASYNSRATTPLALRDDWRHEFTDYARATF